MRRSTVAVLGGIVCLTAGLVGCGGDTDGIFIIAVNDASTADATAVSPGGRDGGTGIGTSGDGSVSTVTSDGAACAANQMTCSDVCVDTASDNANCGGCGNICPSGTACVAGACGTTCGGSEMLCTGDGGASYCANLAGDGQNCGACGAACQGGLVCSNGACAASCTGTQIACNGGCISPASDPNFCGATAGCGGSDAGADAGTAGVVCSDGAHAAAACAEGTCGLVCASGYVDCNALASDGCETQVTTSATSCGACGNACPTAANAAPACTNATCGFTCAAHFDNCDMNATNGCEADLRVSEAHCGACGTACSASQVCAAGVCTSAYAFTLGNSGVESGSAIAADGAGNVYAVGNFVGDGMGQTSLLTHTQTTYGGQDGFIVAVDPSGAYRWSHHVGSASGDTMTAVATDSNGNVYIAGKTSASNIAFSFDENAGITAPTGGDESFVASYTSAGALRWQHIYPSSEAYGLTVDHSNNVIISGQMNGAVDFGKGTITPTGGWNSFLVSYSDQGVTSWSHVYGSGNQNQFAAVTTDASGNIYATGYFGAAENFGSGSNVAYSAGAIQETIVASYTSAGVYRWATPFAGPAGNGQTYNAGQGIAADASGHVAVGGYFLGTINYGNGNITDTNGSNSSEGYIVLLNQADGTYQKAQLLATVGGLSTVVGLGYDPSGNLYTTGSAQGSTNYGGGAVNMSGIFEARYSNALVLTSATVSTGGNNMNTTGIAVVPGGGTALVGTLNNTAANFGTGSTGTGQGLDAFVVRRP